MGGDPANRVELLDWYPRSHACIQFNQDHSLLLATTWYETEIMAIDPITGAYWTFVDTGLDKMGPIAVAGNQHPPGAIAEFGQGLAGAGGIVPSLTGVGAARLGQTLTYASRDFVGGAFSLFLVSSTRLDQAYRGGTVYPNFADLVLTAPVRLPGTPGVPGAGDLDLGYVLLNDPSLLATRWYLQQLAIDPAAIQGVSMTNGSLLYVGE